MSERVHRIATVAIAIIALYFSFLSLLKRDYIIVTSPSPSETISGDLRIDGVKIRTPTACSVRIESAGDVKASSQAFPAVWDSRDFPDGIYTALVEVFGKVAFLKSRVQLHTVQFYIDNTPPIITISGLANGQVVGGETEFSIHVQGGTIKDIVVDDLHRVAISEVEAARVPLKTSSLLDGNHRISILACDPAGNKVSESFSFVVDNAPPRISSLGIPQDIPVRGVLTLYPRIEEQNLASAVWYVDDELVSQKLSLELDTTRLPDGAHTLRLELHDAVDRTCKESATLHVDNTSPVIKLWPDAKVEPVSREVLANGEEITKPYLELFQYQPHTLLKIEITDTDASGLQSKFEMTATTRPTIGTALRQCLGRYAGTIVGRAVTIDLPTLFSRAHEMFQKTRLSSAVEVYTHPFAWDLGSPARVFSIEMPTVGFTFVTDNFMRGTGLRVPLNRILPIPMESEKPLINTFLDIGAMEGTYYRELLEYATSGQPNNMTWLRRDLQANWLKIGFRFEIWPLPEFFYAAKATPDIPFEINWEGGLKLVGWTDVELKESEAEEALGSPPVDENEVDQLPEAIEEVISEKSWFTLSYYMQIGFSVEL